MGFVQIAVSPPARIMRKKIPVYINVMNSYLQCQRLEKIHGMKARIGLHDKSGFASSPYHTMQNKMPNLKNFQRDSARAPGTGR